MSSVNRNISLRALRVFCVAAERESFRTAAERLFLTSSAVSHQVKQLETELGVRLFKRTPRALKLTEAGRALYEDVRPLLSQLDAVTSKHAQTEPKRSLRISVQPFFASELFVPRLRDFLEHHPEIDISVDTSDEALEKHPDVADVSIRVFSRPPPKLAHDLLFQLHLTPAGSPEFYDSVKVRGGRIVSDFPLLVHDSWPKAWREWERHASLRIPDHGKTIRLDSMIAVARAAERGLGAALVPRRLSRSWFESSGLVQLFDHELKTRDAFYLVCRKEVQDNRDIRLLREWVLQTFADNA